LNFRIWLEAQTWDRPLWLANDSMKNSFQQLKKMVPNGGSYWNLLSRKQKTQSTVLSIAQSVEEFTKIITGLIHKITEMDGYLQQYGVPEPEIHKFNDTWFGRIEQLLQIVIDYHNDPEVQGNMDDRGLTSGADIQQLLAMVRQARR
jgi:hypothetical protein